MLRSSLALVVAWHILLRSSLPLVVARRTLLRSSLPFIAPWRVGRRGPSLHISRWTRHVVARTHFRRRRPLLAFRMCVRRGNVRTRTIGCGRVHSAFSGEPTCAWRTRHVAAHHRPVLWHADVAICSCAAIVFRRSLCTLHFGRCPLIAAKVLILSKTIISACFVSRCIVRPSIVRPSIVSPCMVRPSIPVLSQLLITSWARLAIHPVAVHRVAVHSPAVHPLVASNW